MTTVQDLLDRVLAVDTNYQAQISIDETKDVIIKKQESQLLHGIRADGSKIGKYASPAYAKKKFGMNSLAGFGYMDWRLSGELHSEIFVDVRDIIYVIDTADRKAEDLINRLGDPFGLTAESQAQYVDESLEEKFIGNMRKELQL